MTDKAAWQSVTGDAWAEHYVRTDRSFAGLTDVLLGRASTGGFEHAIDVGCGAGEFALALARGHPRSRVTGIDVSEKLVEIASGRGRHLPNVSFHVADAAEWQPDFRPDLIASRHGVMFFDKPVEAFAHLLSITAPAGRMVFSAFRAMGENPWASKVASLLPVERSPDPMPGEPGPFAFADRAYVERLLADAGWQEVAFEAVDFAYVVGVGDDAVEDAMGHFQVIGPAARPYRELDDEDRTRFLHRLRSYLESQATPGLVALPAAAWIVTARAG